MGPPQAGPGAGPPGASRGLQGPPGTRGHSAPGADRLNMWGPRWRDFARGFGVIKGKINVHCIYLALVAGGRAVPPDVREEPGGALYVHSL